MSATGAKLATTPPPDVKPRSFITPHVLTILGTYRCTAMCENCCVDSNPWVKQRLSLTRILGFIDEARRFPSIKMVAFSGGECFLLGNDLVDAVAYANKYGFKTRCVTNGYWAKSLEKGGKRLQALRQAGLSELNISTGDYHQKWVEEKTVVNAACLASEIGFDSIVICVETQQCRQVTAATLLQDPRLDALAKNLPIDKFRIIESPWMPMDASKTIVQEKSNFLNRDNVHTRTGCDSIFSTVVLTPSNKVGVCCGLARELIPELNYPSDQVLEDILQSAAEDFLKIWLFVEGPERILCWAAKFDPRIEWEGRYAHRCHACLAIYQDPRVRGVIRERYREIVDDVLLRYSVTLRRQDVLQGQVYS